MILRITLPNHDLCFKQHFLRLIVLLLLYKDIPNVQKALSDKVVGTVSQYLLDNFQLLIGCLLGINECLLVPLRVVLDISFLNHGLAVGNIQDIMFSVS